MKAKYAQCADIVGRLGKIGTGLHMEIHMAMEALRMVVAWYNASEWLGRICQQECRELVLATALAYRTYIGIWWIIISMLGAILIIFCLRPYCERERKRGELQLLLAQDAQEKVRRMVEGNNSRPMDQSYIEMQGKAPGASGQEAVALQQLNRIGEVLQSYSGKGRQLGWRCSRKRSS